MKEATSKLVAAPNYISPERPVKASNQSFQPHPRPLGVLPFHDRSKLDHLNFTKLFASQLLIVLKLSPSKSSGRTGRKLPDQVQGRRATSPIRKAPARGSTWRTPRRKWLVFFLAVVKRGMVIVLARAKLQNI